MSSGKGIEPNMLDCACMLLSADHCPQRTSVTKTGSESNDTGGMVLPFETPTFLSDTTQACIGFITDCYALLLFEIINCAFKVACRRQVHSSLALQRFIDKHARFSSRSSFDNVLDFVKGSLGVRSGGGPDKSLAILLIHSS